MKTLHKEPKYESMIERVKLSVNWRSFKENYFPQINFSPNYQRGLVWTLEQKQAYILALFEEKADIEPILVDDFSNYVGTEERYICLDGKQRLNAIYEYSENIFPVEGLFYSDLADSDVIYFNSLTVRYERVSLFNNVEDTLPLEIQLDMFLTVNAKGTKQSDDHLKAIQEEYSSIMSEK